MAYRIRFALALLALICAAVVAAALLVPHVVDTAKARRAVSGWLTNNLGREVVIGGSMRFTLLPSVGFIIEDLVVAGGDGPADETVLRVKQVSVAVAPLPLFKRQVVFEQIHLRSPRVALVRDARGRTNWDPANAEKQAPDLDVGTRSAAVLFQFRQLVVEDGTLLVSDAVAGHTFIFSRIGLQRQGLDNRRFKLEAHLECRQSPVSGLAQLNADLRLAGRAIVIPSEDRYAIQGAHLNLTLNRSGSQTPPLANVEAVVSADAAEALLHLEDLRVVGRGAVLRGALTGRLDEEKPSLAGRVSLKIEALEALLASLGVALPSAARLPRSADLDLQLSATSTQLALTRFEGQIDKIPMDGKLVIAAGTPPACRVQLNTGVLDLDAYLPAADERSAKVAPLLASRLAFDLALASEALLWRAHRIDGAHLQMRYAPADGATIQAAGGRFAGGDWKMGGTLAMADDNLAAVLNLAAADVDLAEIRLPRQASAAARGRVDIEADLQLDGHDLPALYRKAAGRIRIETRRPFQLAAFPKTKASGWLEARLGADRNLALALDLQVPDPTLRLSLKTRGLWDDQALALEDAETSLTLDTPILPGSDPRLNLDGRLWLSIADRTAAWRRMRLSVLGLTTGGSFDLDLGQDRPMLNARLDIQPVSLRSWLKTLGRDLPIFEASRAPGQAALKTDLTSDGQSLSLRGLDLTVDETRIRGIADITAFDPLQVRFMLDADRIDLDRYWPADEDSRHPTQAVENKSSSHPPMDIAGTMTVEQLHLFDLQADNVFARVALDQAALRLDSVRLSLYGGSAEGVFTVAIDGSDPVWHTRATADKADLKRPLEIIFGLPVLSGSADIRATLIGRRTEAATAVAGLDGEVNLSIRNGALQGVQIVPDVIAGRQEPSPPTETATDSSPFQPFDTIEGSWTLRSGVAVTDDHRLTGPYLGMTAVGRVDFVQERLDAVLSTDISNIPVVYYALEGPFGDIRVKMDRSRLVGDTTAGIVSSPLKLGQGTLGAGAEILDFGSQVIGDDSGVQQLGQGALTVGKGVLEVGRGVLELHRGGQSLGEGAKSVGEGVYGMGQGVVGVGQDVLDAGIKALEGFGKGLQRLFGGRAENPEADSPAEAQTR